MNDNIPEIQGWLNPQKASFSEYQKTAEEDRKLMHVSREFESIMITSIMKQGLKTAREISGDGEQDSSSKYMDMAYEQLSEHMGRNSGMGLADVIYKSLKNKI